MGLNGLEGERTEGNILVWDYNGFSAWLGLVGKNILLREVWVGLDRKRSFVQNGLSEQRQVGRELKAGPPEVKIDRIQKDCEGKAEKLRQGH